MRPARLRFVSTALIAAGTGLLLNTGMSTEAAALSAAKPNIVFILADDLGRGHVGCYGQTKIHTPNIDRLAAEGMKFSDAYAGANVCAPSRSTLMTGLHTGHTPVRNNGLRRYLSADDVTVAEVLKNAGYATGGFGKWGLGEEDSPGCAVDQGFDEWFGQYNQQHAHFYYPAYLYRNKEKVSLPENFGRKQARYADDEIHREALSFIRRHKDGPFFAYLPYILPHVELTVPEDSRREYADAFPKISRADPRPGYLGSDHAYADFAGMVTRLDRHVGEVMALIKELGIDENTIVFFASDNGPQPGAWSDIFVDYFDGNGPLRGAKGDFYEGGIRTPFIARWPGRIKPGSTSNLPCVFYDMLPTLAELAGAPTSTPTDGISIVPTLLAKGEQTRHEFLYWEVPAKNGSIQALRTGRWKLHRFPGKKPIELYDLATDQGESRNVAGEHADVVARMTAILDHEHLPERKYPPDDRGLGVETYVK